MMNDINGNLSENTMRSFCIYRFTIPDLPYMLPFLDLDFWRWTQVNQYPSDINALILDYLTMAGYPKAAAKFSKEANLQPQQDNSAIKARQEIQHAIHTGSIENAINALNELDPEVWTFARPRPPSNPAILQ